MSPEYQLNIINMLHKLITLYKILILCDSTSQQQAVYNHILGLY